MNSKAATNNSSGPGWRHWHLVLVMGCAAAIAGCSGGSSDMSQLRQRLEELASQPGGEIEPIPQFEEYESFTYSAASLRSPFERPTSGDDEEDDGEAPGQVEPDMDREREPLEQFSLGNLQMVGMLQREGQTMALVRDEAGEVHRVTPGDYMGRNYGQVDQVTAESIELTEIVPSGDGGWVERPRTITLSN